MRNGRYVRTIRHPKGFPIHYLALGINGEIAMYSKKDRIVHIHGINGQFLNSFEEDTCNLAITKDGKFLVTIGKELKIRSMFDFQVVDGRELQFGPASCFLLNPDGSICVALEKGKLQHVGLAGIMRVVS
jgi:hypothetical protein